MHNLDKAAFNFESEGMKVYVFETLDQFAPSGTGVFVDPILKNIVNKFLWVALMGNGHLNNFHPVSICTVQ